MSEESPKDKDSVNRDPETPAADNNPEDSPDRTTNSSKDQADKSESDKTPAKKVNPSDIDSLLSDVADSLNDLENQLGESSDDPATDLADTTGESTLNRKITGGEKNMDLTKKSDKLDQVDSTLEELEKELSSLTEKIDIEQDDAEKPSESETVREEGSPCQEEISEDNIDDILADLADDLDQEEITEQPMPATEPLEKTTSQPVDSTNLVEAENADLTGKRQPDHETINLEAAVQELTEHKKAGEEAGVENEESAVPENIDDLLSQVAQEITDDEQADETVSITEHTEKLPDASGDEEAVPEASGEMEAAEITDSAEPPDRPTSDSADQAGQAQTADEEGAVPENIDDLLSQAAHEITDDEQTDEALSIIDQLPDMVADSQEEEKTADTKAQSITYEVDKDTEERQTQQVVTEELAQIESKEQTSEQQPDPATIDDYDQFSLPQRVLIQSLETANKPFSFIPERFKDTLGLVAVVTLLIATVTAGLILWTNS